MGMSVTGCKYAKSFQYVSEALRKLVRGFYYLKGKRWRFSTTLLRAEEKLQDSFVSSLQGGLRAKIVLLDFNARGAQATVFKRYQYRNYEHNPFQRENKVGDQAFIFVEAMTSDVTGNSLLSILTHKHRLETSLRLLHQ